MHSSRLIALLALLITAPALAQDSEATFETGSFDTGAPVLAYNLAVVPLFTRQAPPYEDFTILEEAQTAKRVSVAEVDRGGQVNQLSVGNQDKRPLYLLGGEVVLGGKQDRMVVADTVVDPGQRRLVDVRCVEAGRWNGADLAFHASAAMAHPELRRLALFDDQRGVWDEVARKSSASGVSSATGTYRRVLQDAKVRERIGHYLDELQRQIPRNERLAGMAVAVNGDLEVVDLFSSPLLYSKLERKLLASYVLTALERQPGAEQARAQDKKAKALKRKDIDDFVKGSGEAGTEKGGRKVFKHKGSAVHETYFGTGKGKK